MHSSLAFDTTGKPWVAFTNSANGNLIVAQHVGTGGNGCTGSTSWHCTVISSSWSSTFVSLAIDQNNNVWVSYYDSTNSDLGIAKYVGNGGNCTSSEWQCTSIENDGATTDRGQYLSLALDADSNPWISYHDATSGSLRYAAYVGSGGTGCAGGTTEWNYADVDNAGSHSSIAFNPSGTAYISYFDSGASSLGVAQRVGSGGSGCTGTSEWTCTAIDDPPGASRIVGQHSRIAFAPNGNPWVIYADTTNNDTYTAQFVGSGGSGCTGTATWQCEVIDDSTTAGRNSSIAFDPAGMAWVTYLNDNTNTLRLARRLGSSGNGCGNGSPAWSCGDIDSGNHGGVNTSLGFNPSGIAWISFHDDTNSDLRIASLTRGGEITFASAHAGVTDNTTTNSHADMVSATDSSNKSDADCATGNAWSNGRWFASESSALSLPSSHCTEVAFVIDTSQTTAGTQYRLAVATNDSWRTDREGWRGPTSINQIPTFTVEANTTTRYSKEAQAAWSNCNDTNWGCVSVDGSTTNVGQHSSIAFDTQGKAWVAYHDATNSSLKVASYVGAGGNCNNGSWQCTTVDSVRSISSNTDMEIGVDASNNPWVAYADTGNNDIRVARFVGTGGSGCSDSTWTCSKVDAVGNQRSINIAFDNRNNPWLSYYDQVASSLYAATYVGAGGSGCTAGITDWNCTLIDDSNNPGIHSSMAVDENGSPWIAYRMTGGGGALKVAKYVGNGGDCASKAWTCTTVATGDTGNHNSIAFGTNNTAWISYQDSSDLRVAQYVENGGSGCSASTWSCSTVESTADVGHNSSIAVDAHGNPWVSHTDQSGSLFTARFTSGSGSGCDNSDWTCSTIETNSGDAATVLAFDRSSSPWVSYFNSTDSNLAVAKLHLSPIHPTYESAIVNPGKSPRTESGTCSSRSNHSGYCGTASNDGLFDSVSAQANESPVAYFASRFASNATVNPITWRGQSSTAPSINAISIEIFRFGSTNAWEPLTPSDENCSTADANSTCVIQATPAGTDSEYFESVSGNYWQYFRVSQTAVASTTELRTEEVLYTIPSNSAPDAPTDLAQFQSDGTTGIPANTMYTYDTTTGGSLDANGGSVTIDNTIKRTGTGSMKITTGASSIYVNDGHVTTRDLSANGATLSAWIYVPASSSGAGWFAYLTVHDSTYTAHSGPVIAVPRDTWTYISYTPSAEVLANMTFAVIAMGGGTGPGDVAYVDDMQQGNGLWSHDTTVVLMGAVTDQDPSDTVQLCVEVKPIASAFDGSDEVCGTGTAFSGSSVVAPTTVAGLADGTTYHWRARAKDAGGLTSSWVSYGENAESDMDLGIDATNPTTGSVFDGVSAGVDASLNDGSLSNLSANWSGFSDNESGIAHYDYAIGTSPGATDVHSWTQNGTNTSMTVNGLSLRRTGATYYVNVRAVDNSNRASAVASSNGQTIAPTLTFSLDRSDITFDGLRLANDYSDSQVINMTASTNTYNGYVIRARTTQPLTSPIATIPAFSGGTHASPDTWQPLDTGLGYTVDDSLVDGINRFQASTCPGGSPLAAPGCFAPFSSTEHGDIVADEIAPITGAPVNSAHAMTIRVTADPMQTAGVYDASLSLSATAIF